MIKKILFGAVLILFFATSCSKKYLQYQADWILVEIDYKGENILGSIYGPNMRIDFESFTGGGVAGVDYGIYKHKIVGDNKFLFESIKGADFISIETPSSTDFFNDRFSITCLNKSCCEIELKNRDKMVKLVYNSELSSFQRRRDCPSAGYVIDSLGLYR